MKKFLSFMLAFLMVFTVVVNVIPPLEVSAASSPYVKTFTSDVDETTVGDTVTFTIKTSANVYGVCLAVRDVNDDGSLTIISTKKSSTKKKSFTIEYSFQKTNATNSSGDDISNTRTVYAFIVDKNGDIIDENDYKDINVTLNPADYEFSDFTTYDCYVDIGSRAKIEWDKVSSEDGSTVTYRVYIDGEFYDDTTRTYMYVAADDVDDYGEGDYWIGVYATAPSHRQKQSSARLYIKQATDTEKPQIDSIDISPSLTITEGETISFSTEVTDDIQLSEVTMYIDGDEVKSVSASGTSKSISYSTSSLAVGTYTVKVKATDAAGNTNEVSTNITVKSKAVEADFSKVTVVDEITVGERITWSGTVSVSGSKINTISVGIMKSTTNGIYYRKTNVGNVSYNIANIQNGYIPTGSTAPAGVRPGANAGEWVNYNDFIINTPGTYWIRVSVYTESGETIKSDAYNITVKAVADKTKPLINPIKLSASKITETTEITISTEASDNIGLKLLTVYIDDIKVKELASKGTTATISYSKSGFAEGKHTVKVVAVDQSGNENFVTTTFEVEKKQSGQIYDITLSSYNFRAGTTITFTVTTSTDTEKLRMSSGNYYFPEITNSKIKGDKKVWTFDQYVETVGENRTLKIETYSGGWTGNTKDVTFTVTAAEQNMPMFYIDRDNIGYSGGSVFWSTPNGIIPDRYVVNVSGPNGDSFETTENTIQFGSGLFTSSGAYTISVTAQKNGYNPYTASITVSLNCEHKNLKELNVISTSRTC